LTRKLYVCLVNENRPSYRLTFLPVFNELLRKDGFVNVVNRAVVRIKVQWRDSMESLFALKANILRKVHFGIFQIGDRVKAYIRKYLHKCV
jgi:hypothetical protein